MTLSSAIVANFSVKGKITWITEGSYYNIGHLSEFPILPATVFKDSFVPGGSR